MTKRITQPWFRFHVAAYMRGTRGLTLAQEGAYIRLLSLIYDSRAPLPASREDIYRLAFAKRRQERVTVDAVLSKYFTLEADGWHNARADEELSRYAARMRGKPVITGHDLQLCPVMDDDIPNDINGDSTESGPLEREREVEGDTLLRKGEVSPDTDLLAANPFTLYVPWLMKHGGMTDAHARSIIGKWRKEVGEPALALHIATAQRLGVSDPRSWITAAIKAQATKAEKKARSPIGDFN